MKKQILTYLLNIMIGEDVTEDDIKTLTGNIDLETGDILTRENLNVYYV